MDVTATHSSILELTFYGTTNGCGAKPRAHPEILENLEARFVLARSIIRRPSGQYSKLPQRVRRLEGLQGARGVKEGS